MKKCLILDYRVGNVDSVRTFFRENNYIVTIGNAHHDIRNTDLLILPGVGSFKTAIENMDGVGITNEIQNRHSEQMPILGICLGFQLLTKESAESPTSVGLGVFNGVTTRIKEFSRIGWGKLDFNDLQNQFSDDYFYFNHSFGTYDVLSSGINASSGLSNYRALAIEDKTVGLQFHPERSQRSGQKILSWLEEEIWQIDG
jgi:glutamine amidotransferase